MCITLSSLFPAYLFMWALYGSYLLMFLFLPLLSKLQAKQKSTCGDDYLVVVDKFNDPTDHSRLALPLPPPLYLLIPYLANLL